MCRLRIVTCLVGAALLLGGCYSPSIGQGKFLCGDGTACPAGFHCGGDNRCYSIAIDASPDVACVSVSSEMESCSAGPLSGNCNPVCQSGCNGCGWCGVVNGSSKCLTGTEGTKTVGETCDPTSSHDCKAGLYCQPGCTSTTGRCYTICDPSNANCPSGSTCTQLALPGNASAAFRLCTLVEACDPVMNTGCPSGLGLGCYPTGVSTNPTECDCPGTTATGGSCTVFNDECVPGDQCVQISGTTSCYANCTLASGCASGTCTATSPTAYGFCM